jgi:hypothetical protein
MKKLIILALSAISLMSCKKQETQEAMTPQFRMEEPQDTTLAQDSTHFKFTLISNKVPYWFNRPDKSGKFSAIKCTTETTVFYEEYIDPKSTVGGVPFGGYTFQASFNSTNVLGDSITIKCEYLNKSVTGTNSGNQALAFVRLRDLK